LVIFAPANAQLSAFVVSVLALIAPVLQRFYDAVIVQLWKVWSKDGFSWKGCLFSTMGLIVFLPTMVLRLLKLDCCGSTIAMGATEMAGDDVNKMAMKLANEGLVSQIDEGIADIASRAFWQVAIDAEYRREAGEEQAEAAARKLQARWRARRAARKRLKQLRLAAAMTVRAQVKPVRPTDRADRPGLQWLETHIEEAEEEHSSSGPST